MASAKTVDAVEVEVRIAASPETVFDFFVDPGESTVEVLLAPDGDGTHLRLIHHDLPTVESAEKHGHGWRHYLARLAKSATGEDPGPDEFGLPAEQS